MLTCERSNWLCRESDFDGGSTEMWQSKPCVGWMKSADDATRGIAVVCRPSMYCRN